MNISNILILNEAPPILEELESKMSKIKAAPGGSDGACSAVLPPSLSHAMHKTPSALPLSLSQASPNGATRAPERMTGGGGGGGRPLAREAA